MQNIEKSLVVPYSTSQLYNLVNDISSYPDFLPWCSSTEILERTDEYIIAAMTVAKNGISKRMVTKNLLTPDKAIVITLVEGPFKSFAGQWLFTETPNGSKISLSLKFVLEQSWLKRILQPIFSLVGHTLVEAFSERAKKVYG